MPPTEPTNQVQPAHPRKHRGRAASLVILVIVVVAIAVVVHHKPSTTGIAKLAPAEVSITKTGFLPATITIALDQAVVWTNDTASPHIVASDPYPKDDTLPDLNSESSIAAGQTYSYVFNKAGTYTYHDNLNPYTIKGTVIVKP